MPGGGLFAKKAPLGCMHHPLPLQSSEPLSFEEVSMLGQGLVNSSLKSQIVSMWLQDPGERVSLLTELNSGVFPGASAFPSRVQRRAGSYAGTWEQG